MKKNIFLAGIVLSASIALGGCATSNKVQTVQTGDQKMSCGELQAELSRLDATEKEVDSKKGVTGTNVAAALLWIPGLAYTYYDAGQAVEAINGRRAHISKLYNAKNCS